MFRDYSVSSIVYIGCAVFEKLIGLLSIVIFFPFFFILFIHIWEFGRTTYRIVTVQYFARQKKNSYTFFLRIKLHQLWIRK